jgi:serine/threonine protein kinase
MGWGHDMLMDMCGHSMSCSVTPHPSRFLGLVDARLVVGKSRSFASDVWSFGMMMSEMVKGNIPFSSMQSPIAIAFALGSGRGLEREVGYAFDHPMFRELMEHCVLREVLNRPFMTNIIQSLEEMR